jgi:cytosine/adenosine deaminase-related metal-dependent hydrolase
MAHQDDDMLPPDFYLFPWLKSVLKGRFASAKEVTAKVMRALIEVLKNGFQERF